MISNINRPQQIRVGSYNVKNLFDAQDIGPESKTKPKSELSKRALARVIEKSEFDVCALQETSSKETLERFMKSQGLDQKYPFVAHIQGNSERGINVAIISKYPFETVVSHKDARFPLADGSGETKFSRDLLRVDVNTDGVPGAELSLYTTHSKSRLPAQPGDINPDTQRLSEAMAMRNIAETEMKEFPNRVFFISGDMNDNTDDASVQAVLHPKDGREEWVDSLAHLPAGERNTWPANPNAGHGHDPEQFDHLIFPKSQQGKIISSQIHRYAKDGDINWLSSAASDHLPISVDVRVN